MRALVGERDERAARTATSALEEQLNHRAAAVHSLALRAADNSPLDEILSSSDFLLPDFDAGLAFFTRQGELLAANGEASLWDNQGGDFAVALSDFLAGADSQPKFSATLLHPVNGELIVLVAAADRDGERIAVGAFYPATLARKVLIGAFSPGEQALAFVVDPDYQILYQIGDFVTQEDLHTHPGVEGGIRGESGTTYLQIDGSEHVIAFSPVPTTNWALVIEEPWEAVVNPLLNTTQLAPLILVPVLLLALVALWFGARQIVQPLQDLESRSADLAWGNFQAIEEPVGGIDEIERLQHTLIHLSHKIQSAQKSLRGYIGAITTGQEEERRRLARELHDDTIQSLIALGQRVQLTRLNLADEQLADASLEEIQALNEQTITDLRRLTRALRPLYLEDLGLVAALEMLVRETGHESEIVVDFQRIGAERRLPPDIELALYRMMQEGLSNVIRHSHAEKSTLSIQFTTQEVILTISDDGHGFEVPESPAEFAPSGHFGLLGIHERAELIGARLDIHSTLGEGTQLVVSLPLGVGDNSYLA
jgi:signal transduction histidine kinase